MSTINVTVKRASSLNVTVRSKQPINVTVDKTGATGLSAYEIWLAEGNTGTEQDFLDSLEGAQGEPGADGQPGATEAIGVSYDNLASGLTAAQVQAAIDELAARPNGGGGVPDEAWQDWNLDNKIITTIPISTPATQPENTLCRLVYTRVGRKVEGQGIMVLPATIDWGTPDPYFPLNLMGLLSTDLPFRPRIYQVITEIGTNTPNVGGFSIINTVEENGDPIPDNSMAIGSVITNFGGSLAVPLFLFFHAAQTNAGNLENLVFDGNKIDLVGKAIVIYFGLNYEAAYEEGYIGIADTLPNANENVAYSESLAVTISSPLQLPLASAEVVAGALPDGISVAIDGESLEISGTPTVDGEYTFTIEVTGSNDDSGTQEVTLTVGDDVPPPYNPEDDPQYLGTVSGGSYNINFENGDPSQSIHTYVATAGEILKIRTSTLNYDFGEGAISVPVGEYIIYEGGYWRHYIYE